MILNIKNNKRRFKVKYVLIAILILLVAAIVITCKNGPIEPPVPNEEVEYYDYEVTYVRTAINMPDEPDPQEAIFRIKDEIQNRWVALTKKDDYTFTGIISHVPTHLKKDTTASNLVYIVDPKRWTKKMQIPGTIGMGGVPHSVGDIIYLKNIQTGITYKLEKIVDNPLLSLPPEFDPEAAQFKTRKDGIVVNE